MKKFFSLVLAAAVMFNINTASAQEISGVVGDSVSGNMSVRGDGIIEKNGDLYSEHKVIDIEY